MTCVFRRIPNTAVVNTFVFYPHHNLNKPKAC